MSARDDYPTWARFAGQGTIAGKPHWVPAAKELSDMFDELDRLRTGEYTYRITATPKMLRETLCVAQTHVGNSSDLRVREHVARMQELIDECDRKRPLGSDGKHGELHTNECGCDQ